jgi:tRNA-binding protein
MEHISWQHFDKVELRAGTIVRVEDFPEAHKPAYKIWADFGNFGVMKSSAQLTKLYRSEVVLAEPERTVPNGTKLA